MKFVWFIAGHVVVGLVLAACSEAIATSAPTAAPAVAEVATAAPTNAVTSAEAAVSPGPRAGDAAPDFTLPDTNGSMVHLADELKNNRAVVLIFYLEHG